MVKTAVEALSSFLQDVIAYIPPGLFPCFASAFIEGGKYLSLFRHEFVGSLLMIVFTFSAGKWIFSESVRMAWTAHALGVIAADCKFRQTYLSSSCDTSSHLSPFLHLQTLEMGHM